MALICLISVDWRFHPCCILGAQDKGPRTDSWCHGAEEGGFKPQSLNWKIQMFREKERCGREDIVSWKCKCYSLSRVRLFVTPWTVACQTPLSMGFPMDSKNTGVGILPFPSPGELPNPGIKPRSPALQADSSLSEPHLFFVFVFFLKGKNEYEYTHTHTYLYYKCNGYSW